MKVNCKALKLSIIITIISLILLIIFQILSVHKKDIIIDVFTEIILGIFSSSIITIFFYASAYKIERRKLLENYWLEIVKILNNFKKIEYMNINFDEHVTVGFIHEHNQIWIEQFSKTNPRNKILIDLTNTNLIKKTFKEDNKEILEQLSEIAKERFLNEQLEKLYQNLIKKIDKVTEQYLEYLNCSIESLNCILGDMEFFTGKKNYQKAYKMFQDIYKLRVKIIKAARHFRYYKEKNGNEAVVLSEILNLQKNIFRVEEKENCRIVYNEFIDNMNKKIEEFRAKVIYGVEIENIKEVPILQLVNNVKVAN